MHFFVVVNTSDSFLNYLENYPQSPYSEELLSILYHMNPEVFFGISTFPDFKEKIDSLRVISELNTHPLLPFIEKEKIGFINLKGIPILKPNYHSLLKQELLCRTLQTDIIGVSYTSGVKQLINRAGKSIYSGPINTYEDLGFGFIKIKEPTQIKIIQKPKNDDSRGDFSFWTSMFLDSSQNGVPWTHGPMGPWACGPVGL